ncbi:MAG: PorT family protein [Flavobacteriaceae bacterium]|jgi:hypothetical protein|nr:PorT family protein [Flavobacteriaceae bacterium]
MKKGLVILFLCLASVQLCAQEKQKFFQLGFRTGLNVSNVSNMSGFAKASVYFGVQGPMQISKFYVLQPEVSYTRQGANKVFIGDERISKGQLTLDYIDIATTNKLMVDNFYFLLGTGLSILTYSSEANISNADLFLNFGVGYNITRKFGVEARWKKGLADINYLPEDSPLWDPSMKYETNTNYTLQLGIYYKL